ncbi:MAG: helix-turn-helix domain-containing protein [Planctomycetales bacterium]
MSELLNQIRQAIEASGVSRYRISQDTGIDQGHLSRLMNDKGGTSVETVEKLCQYLELEVVVQPKKPRRTRRQET